MDRMTPEEFQQMIGSTSNSSSQMPQGRMTPEQFQSMVSGKTDGLDQFNKNTRNQTIRPVNQESVELPDSRITGNKTVDSILNGIGNFGAGVSKSLYGGLDALATAANEVTDFTDDPNFRFGTESRKDKVQRLFKAKTPLGKAGRTTMDIAQIVAPTGEITGINALGGATKAIGETRPVTNLLLSNSRLANFAGRVLPRLPQEIAEGAAFSGYRGDQYNAGNAAADTASVMLAPVAVKMLARLVPGGSKALSAMSAEEAVRVYDDIYKRASESGDTEVLDKFNDHVNTQIQKVGENISNIKNIKSVLKSTEEFANVAAQDENAVAKNFGEFLALRVGPELDKGFIKGNNIRTTDIELKKNFAKTIDDVTNNEMRAVRGIVTGSDNRFNISQAINDTINDVMKYENVADSLPKGVDRKIGDFLDTYKGKGTLKILSMSVYDIAKEAGVEPSVARGIKNSLMKQLEERISKYGPDTLEMVRDSLKNLQYSAMAKTILKKIDGSVVGNDLISKKLFSNLTAALAMGGSFNPAAYFATNWGAGKIYDMLSSITAKSKLNRKALFASARKNNIGKINAYPNKIASIEEKGRRIGAQKFGEFRLKQDMDELQKHQEEFDKYQSNKEKKKLKGLTKGKAIAEKRKADYEKWLQKQIDVIESEKAGVPVAPKELVQEAKASLDESIDTAKEVRNEIKALAKQKGMSEQEVVNDLYADIARRKKELAEIKDTAPVEYHSEIDSDLENLDNQIELLRKYNDLSTLQEKRKLFGRKG